MGFFFYVVVRSFVGWCDSMKLYNSCVIFKFSQSSLTTLTCCIVRLCLCVFFVFLTVCSVVSMDAILLHCDTFLFLQSVRLLSFLCDVAMLLSLLNCIVQFSDLILVLYFLFFIFWHENSASSIPRFKLSILFDTTTTCQCAVGVADLQVEPSHAVSEEGGSSWLKLSM